MTYTYRTIWSDEDDEYVGLCDEFPGLSWLEPIRHDAFEGIQRLVAEVVADMRANGETAPN